MKTINKQPKIRFKGYTDEWQQRKLGEIIQVNSGKDYKHLNKGEIPVYGTGGYMLSVDEALSYKDAIGLGRKGTINKPYLLKAPFWTVDTLFYSIPINNNDLLFINTLFQNINWKKYDESTGVPSLSKNSIIRIEKKVPNIEEQEKIGLFFLKLSDTIALHQRKLEALEKTKKSFLQKMFPKKDETKPEIRFSGFTDDWEQRKLGDFLTERKEMRVQDDEYPLVSFTVEKGVTPKTDRYEREQLVVGNKKSKKYKVTELNDIVYNPANLKFGAISMNKFGRAVFSPIYVTFQVDTNKAIPFFIESYVTRRDFIKFSLKYQQGTVYERQSVSVSDFIQMNVNIPSKKEQQKIGTFFKQLDDTIALHQRQLEVLKNMKTSFLQKMYI